MLIYSDLAEKERIKRKGLFPIPIAIGIGEDLAASF